MCKLLSLSNTIKFKTEREKMSVSYEDESFDNASPSPTRATANSQSNSGDDVPSSRSLTPSNSHSMSRNSSPSLTPTQDVSRSQAENSSPPLTPPQQHISSNQPNHDPDSMSESSSGDEGQTRRAGDPDPEATQKDSRLPPPRETESGQRLQSANVISKKRRPFGMVATVRYPKPPVPVPGDMLDPTKKHQRALTKPKGPSFVETMTNDNDRLHPEKMLQSKRANQQRTVEIDDQRNNERKYLKAQYEFEREKRLAEQAIYHRERVAQWAARLGASPLGLDLAAESERLGEMLELKEREKARKKKIFAKRKHRMQHEIIIQALANVPVMEESRRQKRQMLAEERREKAWREVQRAESVQDRKIQYMLQMAAERQQKLDSRLMRSTMNVKKHV